FFQAEDGIRDFHVTGVQTCALPICPELMERFQKQAERFGSVIHMENVVEIDFSSRPFLVKGESVTLRSETVIIATGATAKWLGEIGRASCRERVEMAVVGVSGTTKE